MSVSRCILLVGKGNRYHDEGLVPEDIFTYYDDKNVWHWQGRQNNQGGELFRSSHSRNFFYDVLLFYAAKYLVREESEKHACHELTEAVGSLRDNNGRKVPQKVYDRCRQLYNEDKSCLKMVGVFLANEITVLGGFTGPGGMKGLFVEAAKEFNVRSYEVCEATSVNTVNSPDNEGRSER